MVNEKKTKVSKKELKEEKKTTKKKEELKRKKKCNSGDDDDDDFDTESDVDDELDIHEYRKLLAELYPSKFINKKVEAGEKVKKVLENEKVSSRKRQVVYSDDEEEEEEDSEYEEEDEDYDDDDDEEDYDDEEEEDEEDEEDTRLVTKKASKKNKENVTMKMKEKESKKKSTDKKASKKSKKEEEEEEDEEEEEEEVKKTKKGVNMVFTIGLPGESEYDEDYDPDEDWSEEESDTEDEDESVSDVSTDDDEEDDEEEEEEEEEEVPVKKSNKGKKETKGKETKGKDTKGKETKGKETKETKKSKEEEEEEDEEEEKKVDEEKEDNDDPVLKQLKEMYEKDPSNKAMKECIDVYEKKQEHEKKKSEKKLKKQKAKNMRIFRKIGRDKNTMNDFHYFEKLDFNQQKKIIKELREINKSIRLVKPYKITLLEADIPCQFKGEALKKVNTLRYMDAGTGEYYKIKNWVDSFMRIPFGQHKTLPVSINDGVEACHEFMENAKNILDSAVYGLNDAKLQIMQMLGQLITNPTSVGTAIAIKGPPGTGKTSLVREGISKILNRPFAFIALGGATDSSFLEGHSYTYEGSTWGRIVQILIDSKCMNPVFYFDELDKISDTPKGEEIAGILTHLTDTTQNSQFHDKYFAELDFDLSKCLFIFSYNDESKVNPILKDRMYRIMTKGYEKKQKTTIANDYLLPKIREQVKFEKGDIVIPDETLHYIIENYCDKEDGVRNLKRCLEIIHTKLNLYRLMKPGTNLFEEDIMITEVVLPFTVTKEMVDKLIKVEKKDNTSLHAMYV